jgi:hypothetical protein
MALSRVSGYSAIVTIFAIVISVSRAGGSPDVAPSNYAVKSEVYCDPQYSQVSIKKHIHNNTYLVYFVEGSRS